jgi:hypothetical protein
MGKKVPNSIKDRDLILNNHRQKSLIIKFETNRKNINTEKPLFIQEIKKNGLNNYLVFDHKTEEMFSNVNEIFDTNKKLLWRKNNKN